MHGFTSDEVMGKVFEACEDKWLKWLCMLSSEQIKTQTKTCLDTRAFALLGYSWANEDINDMIKGIKINHPDSRVDEVGLTSNVVSNAIPRADRYCVLNFKSLL